MKEKNEKIKMAKIISYPMYFFMLIMLIALIGLIFLYIENQNTEKACENLCEEKGMTNLEVKEYRTCRCINEQGDMKYFKIDTKGEMND